MELLEGTLERDGFRPTDLYSPIYKRVPLAQAQVGIGMYINDMSAGKVLLVADPREVAIDSGQ